MAARRYIGLLTFLVAGCVAPPVAVPPPPLPSAAAAGGTTIVAVAPAAAPHPTLFDFLGLTPLCGAIQQDVHHKLAFFGTAFPFLEPKPPLLLLTDPANLASPVPAVAAAAEIKAEQDLAPQKVKALKYLATIGCGGCYPGVEEALLTALEDCTEEVRFEAVRTIYFTAGNPCVACNNRACCTPKLRKKLEWMAYEGLPCPNEPSARVRRMARVALDACGGPPPLPEPVPQTPTEVIPEGELPPTEVVPPPPVAAGPTPATAAVPVRQRQVGPTLAEHPGPAKGTPSDQLPPEVIPAHRTEPAQKASPAAPEPVSPEPVSPEGIVPAALAVTGNVSGAAATSQTAGPKSLPPASEDELLAYYARNLERYREPARVRWEEISVRVNQFPNSSDGLIAITYVRERATNGRAVQPEGFRPELFATTDHGWTATDQVKSVPISAALFSLPVGAISPVLRVDDRYVLVRVLERKAAATLPFNTVIDRVRRDHLAEKPELTEIPETAERPQTNGAMPERLPAESGKVISAAAFRPVEVGPVPFDLLTPSSAAPEPSRVKANTKSTGQESPLQNQGAAAGFTLPPHQERKKIALPVYEVPISAIGAASESRIIQTAGVQETPAEPIRPAAVSAVNQASSDKPRNSWISSGSSWNEDEWESLPSR